MSGSDYFIFRDKMFHKNQYVETLKSLKGQVLEFIKENDYIHFGTDYCLGKCIINPGLDDDISVSSSKTTLFSSPASRKKTIGLFKKMSDYYGSPKKIFIRDKKYENNWFELLANEMPNVSVLKKDGGSGLEGFIICLENIDDDVYEISVKNYDKNPKKINKVLKDLGPNNKLINDLSHESLSDSLFDLRNSCLSRNNVVVGCEYPETSMELTIPSKYKPFSSAFTGFGFGSLISTLITGVSIITVVPLVFLGMGLLPKYESSLRINTSMNDYCISEAVNMVNGFFKRENSDEVSIVSHLIR